MKIDTVELRRAAEAELAAATAKYKSTLKWIDEIERVARGQNDVPQSNSSRSDGNATPGEKWRGLREFILSLASVLPEQFTVHDVRKHVLANPRIHLRIKDKSISTTLSSMVRATKELDAVTEGGGTIANVYRFRKSG